MEEFSLRLPDDMKEALQTEAAQRGVTVGEHIRDIIDSYHGAEAMTESPDLDIEYQHTVENGEFESGRNSDPRRTDTEEIGSFSYGSRSILSQ